MVKQIILDTNILARYLLRDIESQYIKAKEIISSIEDQKVVVNISILVIDELIWAMENFYGYKRNEYIPQIMKVFSLKNMRIIEVDKGVIVKIFGKMLEKNIDFTDFYLVAIRDKREIFSFDRDLAKLMKG